MAIKDWPDLRTGTGEVAKNLNFLGERWENSFGDNDFGFLFSPRTSLSKLQNVNIILLDALPDTTGALSNAFIVYYSSNRYLCNQHF